MYFWRENGRGRHAGAEGLWSKDPTKNLDGEISIRAALETRPWYLIEGSPGSLLYITFGDITLEPYLVSLYFAQAKYCPPPL